MGEGPPFTGDMVTPQNEGEDGEVWKTMRWKIYQSIMIVFKNMVLF